MDLHKLAEITESGKQILLAAEFMDIYFDEEETLQISLSIHHKDEALLNEDEVIKLAQILSCIMDVSVNLEFIVLYELH